MHVETKCDKCRRRIGTETIRVVNGKLFHKTCLPKKPLVFKQHRVEFK